MAIVMKSMTVILSGVLLIAGAVTLPLSPVFGEGGARRDVVRHAAGFARAESAGPSSLSKHATILGCRPPSLSPSENGTTTFVTAVRPQGWAAVLVNTLEDLPGM